jgi:oligopeptide/dipeptide ABC transporter ATP-binding protein
MILVPQLIVADEPVAMLDMSIRAKVLELMLQLKRKFNLTYLFITHDLATAKFLCDRIAIMYLGRIVEIGPAKDIYKDPKHPYTKALLRAIPIPDPRKRGLKDLPKGEVPDAVHPPAGCRFHPRCPAVLSTCGWEGRDFIDYLEERRTNPEKAKADEVNLGSLELWKAEGLVAERPCEPSNIGKITEYVRSILNEAPVPLAQAVERVNNIETKVVLRFRTPDPLGPKEVEGRLVECLLY